MSFGLPVENLMEMITSNRKLKKCLINLVLVKLVMFCTGKSELHLAPVDCWRKYYLFTGRGCGIIELIKLEMPI